MRGKHAKSTAKKRKLAGRVLSLCFALVFVCSCLLPAFAYATSGADYGLDTNTSTEFDMDSDTGIALGEPDISLANDPDIQLDDGDTGIALGEPIIATVTYRFWLKQLDTDTLKQLSEQAGEYSPDEGIAAYERQLSSLSTEFYKAASYLNYGTRTKPSDFTNPSRNDKTFMGWYTLDEYGSEVEFKFDGDAIIVDDSQVIDVFAKWADNATDGDASTSGTSSNSTSNSTSKPSSSVSSQAASGAQSGSTSTKQDTTETLEHNYDFDAKIHILVECDEDLFEGYMDEFMEIDGFEEYLNLMVEQVLTEEELDIFISRFNSHYGMATAAMAVAANLELSEQIERVDWNSLSIEDDTVNSGRFILKVTITTADGIKRTYNGTAADGEAAADLLTKNGYTITWSNNSGIIERKLANGTAYTRDENGGWVNVSYTYPKGMEAAPVTYTVTVEKGTETHPANATTKYFKKLMNGDFEEPYTYIKENNAPLFDVPYWKTTQDDNLLEVVGDRDWSPLKNYFEKDREILYGDRAVELNAARPGTLYQTVLTVPGQELNWTFCHRARTTNISHTGTDTMAMLIVPEALCRKISSNDKNPEALRKWAIDMGRSASNGEFAHETSYGGDYQVYVARHDSIVERKGTQKWNGLWWETEYHYYSEWDDLTGHFTAPDDWYVVRFFFVAVDSCYGGADSSVGNIIDHVSFGQDPPTFESSKVATVTVTKKVYGLDDLTPSDAEALLREKNFINGVTLGDWTTGTDGGGAYYEASFTETKPMFSTSSPWNPTYKEEFANAQLNGYNLTSAKAECVEDSYEASWNKGEAKNELAVTTALSRGQSRTIVFTNTYAKDTTTVTLTKEVTGNAAVAATDFGFRVTVTKGNDDVTANVTGKITKADGSEDTNVTLGGFNLQGGWTLTLSDVPIGATVTVQETNPNGYTLESVTCDGAVLQAGDSGYSIVVAEGTDKNQITFTNDKHINPDTGVILDTLPYVLILGAVAAAVAVMVARKRRHEDE